MTYVAVLANGLVDIALPNGQIAQGGQTAILTDDEYEQLSPTALTTLFSSITMASGTIPASTVTPFRPVYIDNPYAEQEEGEPSASETPLNTPDEEF